MKKSWFILSCILIFSSMALAQNKPAGQPPIIDRDLIFGNPEIAGAQLSPDGHYIAFQKPWKDTRNVYVKGVNEPFSAARLMTTETKRPVAGYLWTQDSKYIVFRQGQRRRRELQRVCGRSLGQAAAGEEAPPSRDLTGLKGVRVMLFAAPKSDPDIYIGLNDRDKAWHDFTS